MNRVIENFLRGERGAISVDWVVLAAAAVAMSLAASDVVREGIRALTSNVEGQLRTQQISDAFVSFVPSHFDMLYDAAVMTEEEAEVYFEAANELMNAEVLDSLEYYIAKMVNGTISDEELQEAFAVASVAYQRNIVDDSVIDYYFAPDGGFYSEGGDDDLVYTDG